MQMILKSKYVVYFIEQVKGWQTKLNVADSVIPIWMAFQHMWYLHQSNYLPCFPFTQTGSCWCHNLRQRSAGHSFLTLVSSFIYSLLAF